MKMTREQELEKVKVRAEEKRDRLLDALLSVDDIPQMTKKKQ